MTDAKAELVLIINYFIKNIRYPDKPIEVKKIMGSMWQDNMHMMLANYGRIKKLLTLINFTILKII